MSDCSTASFFVLYSNLLRLEYKTTLIIPEASSILCILLVICYHVHEVYYLSLSVVLILIVTVETKYLCK